MPGMPIGTVTFLFTDIEGSTRLWETHAERMSSALARHDALMRGAIESEDGHVFKTVGDAFCATFHTPQSALLAAIKAQAALDKEPWPEETKIKVRMALHTGAVEVRDNDYFGQPLSRVARLLSTGHGGQVLMSLATQELVRDGLPAHIILRDMGAVRLKDLIRPEHVFQAHGAGQPSTFPPLKTLDMQRHNLPVQSTSFVGRQQEIEEISRMLAVSQLVTLVGTGGAGKTRLSLQVAADRIEQFPGGAWLVDLSAVTDPLLVPQAMASVLAIKPAAGNSWVGAMTADIRERGATMLVLDNCEHLVAACADLCQRLTAVCPDLKMLATSREALRIPGEVLMPIAPLPTPHPQASMTPAALEQFAAVQLFIDRARAVRPSFTVDTAGAPALASICHRLDGIPLAIELAAARLKSMSLQEVNERLGERFRLLTGGSRTALPRQQTLRSLIDWSYDLLSSEEKLMLGRMSVFAGGCDIDAAQEVCGDAPMESWQTLDVLSGLADKSLLTVEEREGRTRYRMLESIRQYAAERLEAAGEMALLRRRHLQYFVKWVESLCDLPDPRVWTSRFEEDIDNLRVALAWSPKSDVIAGLRMADALGRFWFVRGYMDEGRRWVRPLLDSPRSHDDLSLRGKVLHSEGSMARFCGDFPAARAALEEALAITRALGETKGIAVNLRVLSVVSSFEGDDAAATGLAEESLAFARQLGDGALLAGALNTLGNLALDHKDYARAEAMHDECLAVARQMGDPTGISIALGCLGHTAFRKGDHARALDLCRQALAIRHELHQRIGVDGLLMVIADIASAAGDVFDAARLWGKVSSLLPDPGLPKWPAESRGRFEGKVAAAREACADREAFDRAWTEGFAMDLDDAVRHALDGTIRRSLD